MSRPSIAIWTLTRDRLEYTQRTFAGLREHAGAPFRHYVVDNGSTDGTREWLLGQRERGELHAVTVLPTNLGIGGAGNLALEQLARDGGADFVVKLDNDCELITPQLLPRMLEAFAAMRATARCVLSPRVEGIDRQPRRARELSPAPGVRIGVTGHVGGLFLMAPWRLWDGYRFPENLPKARGYDSAFSARAKRLGAVVGYVEDLAVAHMDTTGGQARRYPEYFARKRGEEK